MKALDVIWTSDTDITPPGPKVVVCVEPNLGFFLRINSHDNWQPCVRIERVPHHSFLKWDSYIECCLIELDDFIVSRALAQNGIIGNVSPTLCRPLLEALGGAGISRQDRLAIWAALEPLIPR